MNELPHAERFRLIAAVHLFLVQEGQILLLRRFNTGYADGQYSVVGGHLDGGEEVKTAMIREAREEAGIDIAPDDLGVVGVMHRASGDVRDERVDFFLAASVWHGEIFNRVADKCDDLSWFEIEDLPTNTVPYVRQAIENYRRDAWFDSFGFR